VGHLGGLPDADGRDFCQALRSHGVSCPVSSSQIPTRTPTHQMMARPAVSAGRVQVAFRLAPVPS
jgi:hypothetical protein